MMKILVTAGSKNGSTLAIGQAIADQLSERGFDVTTIQPQDVDGVHGYDAVIIGSAVYMGKWTDSVTRFVNRFGDDLATRPVWLFSSGPVGAPDGKWFAKMQESEVESVDAAKILEATKARGHKVFAGKLTTDGMPMCQRIALKAFRSMQGDFRDWDEIKAWASEVADALDARFATVS